MDDSFIQSCNDFYEINFKVFFLLSNKSNLSSLQFENLFKSIFFLLFFPPFLLIKVDDFEQMCLVAFSIVSSPKPWWEHRLWIQMLTTGV